MRLDTRQNVKTLKLAPILLPAPFEESERGGFKGLRRHPARLWTVSLDCHLERHTLPLITHLQTSCIKTRTTIAKASQHAGPLTHVHTVHTQQAFPPSATVRDWRQEQGVYLPPRVQLHNQSLRCKGGQISQLAHFICGTHETPPRLSRASQRWPYCMCQMNVSRSLPRSVHWSLTEFIQSKPFLRVVHYFGKCGHSLVGIN